MPVAIKLGHTYYLLPQDGLRGPVVELSGVEQQKLFHAYVIYDKGYSCSDLFAWGNAASLEVAIGYRHEYGYTIPHTNIVTTAYWPIIGDELLWEWRNKDV